VFDSSAGEGDKDQPVPVNVARKRVKEAARNLMMAFLVLIFVLALLIARAVPRAK
jgi:hypothetical protein